MVQNPIKAGREKVNRLINLMDKILTENEHAMLKLINEIKESQKNEGQ